MRDEAIVGIGAAQEIAHALELGGTAFHRREILKGQNV